ncbi:thioester reductase domain-containing protein [Streptomyces sp. GXMU-J15]|uniref:Thioester reductase domain-containing protein n=1 Tax=Streptomyces fuscus TaxID=3048495 RepID=A0ABT7J3X7_9ACTN|nr:type I polyketide synthase [Streptomyces fuscus]MDL2078283.1 thioester reductase domain-containing protein [Streptomyces fuscus]
MTTPDYRARLVEAVRTIEKLKGELAKNRSRPLDEPIAIIGLGCRLPGGANSPDSLWRMLVDGTDTIREFPAERGDAQAVFDADPDQPGKAYVTQGGFLDERVDLFEPGVFGISPREAVGMDPQQRIGLEVAWEALERAGYAPDRLTGSATGVYFGVSTTDYARLRQSEGDIRDVDAYQLVGEPSFVAGRISYTLGLMGPSKVVDTTCSSSLVALHEACQDLRTGECDMALAGGVNLMLSPYGFVMMSKFGGLSPDGRCKTFDAGANGYVRGEGAGVVVLKRYSDARRDGDPVLALVRGSAVNHDGRSSGLTVPNPAAQQGVIRGALEQAQIAPGDVDYVEAHGTGTALGDPIELRALQAVIGRNRPADKPLKVGSIKTNIGHLESAAGIAGVLKLVLALQHGELPPHLHFNEPNPNVDWGRLNVEVTKDGGPWGATGDRPRIGGISSFGASGTNAHAVISAVPEPAEPADPSAGPQVLTLSAHSAESLTALAGRYATHLRDNPGVPLADISWTSQVGRSRQRNGLAVTGSTAGELADALEAFGRGERGSGVVTAELPVHKHRKTAWLFTGQGSQYAGMARGLADVPAFRVPFDEAADLFDVHLDRPLASVVWPEPGQESPVDDTRYTQPALFAVEYALARMWQSWGLRPSGLLGHSIGGIVAACIAGVFELPDAVRLVAARAALMAALPEGGAMAALDCDEATARAAISGYRDTVSLAGVNGPSSVVISGAAADVDAVRATLEARGMRTTRLTVSHAFHSPLLAPMLADFRAVAESLTYRMPTLPLISDHTGRPWTAEDSGPEYWVRHAAGTVRFHDGLTALHAEGARTFLEIGPSPVLSGIGERTGLDGDCLYVPSLYKPRAGAPEDRTAVQRALGLLHLRGETVDWTAVHSGAARAPRRVPLPVTPWNGERYWYEERREAPRASAGTPVPVAGVRLHSAVPTYEQQLDSPEWDRYARTGADGFRFLPVGSLGRVARAAAGDALGGVWSCVEKLEVFRRIPMERAGRVLQVTVDGDEDGCAIVTLHTQTPAEAAAGAPWTRHARAVLRRRASTRSRHSAPTLAGHEYADDLHYETASLSDALIGAVLSARRGDEGVLVALGLDSEETAAHAVQVFDAAVAAVSWDAGLTKAGYAGRITEATLESLDGARYVRAIAQPGKDPGTVCGSVDLFSEDGAYLGGIRELMVVIEDAKPAAEPAPWRDPEELLTRLEWQETEPAAAAPDLSGQGWLLVPDRTGTARRLATALRALGADARIEESGAPDLDDWLGRLPDGVTPHRVVLLTGLDAPRPDAADADSLTAFRDRAELAAVALVQGLSARAACTRTGLSLVTRGAVPALPEQGVTSPFAGTLWGLGRAIALEHPEHWAGAIDLDPDAGESDEGTALAAALADTAEEDQQALRGTGRRVARLVKFPLSAEELRRRPTIDRQGTYLITGAFGGIGQALARDLADSGAGKLVLLGRTPLPPREQWNDPSLTGSVRERVDFVSALEETGVLVEVVAADVNDVEEMLPVVQGLATGLMPLRGVVHAAGTSVPQFLRDIPVDDPRDYDAVWRPKVVGGWLLHQLTEGLELDFFLGFSSIAATWGSQHVTSYAAANSFLDALAEYRHTQGLTALTVSWGPWELTSNLFGADVVEFLTSTGLRMLSAPQCLKLLNALLAQDAPQAVVCSADWARYKPVMEARADRPVLRTVEIDEGTGGGTSTAVLQALEGADPAGRAGVLTGYLQQVLGEVLAVPPESVLPEADVMSHGLDSLMVMEVVKRCKGDLGISVRPSQFFERTTLEDWVRLLDTELGGEGEAAPEPAADWTEPARIAADVHLDPAIVPAGPVGKGYTDPTDVLLTGATGFLGAYILDELLATTGATVHCLVRCDTPEAGLERIKRNLEQYLPWREDAEARIEVVPGDLGKPRLGLSEAEFTRLAGLLDGIYHNGAWVNFSYTYEQLRPANLSGTEEILRLACAGPTQIPVSYVSTYGIWGIPADGRTVIAEGDDILGAGKLVTGYVQTKWAAELLVRQAQERGIPVDVHRPGRVLGDSRTGACLTTHFTTRVIKGCVQLGMAPDLDLEIEMTPVDYVTSALVRISREEHRWGLTYHLVNRRKAAFKELLEAMERHGWEFRTVPVEQWWRALQDSFAVNDNELHPVMGVVEEFVVGGEEAIDYDATNTLEGLAGSGIACPPLDGSLLSLYFGWMVRTGYLPAPSHRENNSWQDESING